MYRLSVGTLPDVVLPEPPPPSEGLYTNQEITDMINNDDYIPVATAAELDSLRTETTQTMGAGTIWEAQYLTGLDKKYVQVDDLDLVGYANWSTIGVLNSAEGFNGLFDGNNLDIINFTKTTLAGGLFGLVGSGELYNIRLYGHNTSTAGDSALLTGRVFGILGVGGIIKNCIATGSVVGGTNHGGILTARTGGAGDATPALIEDCEVYANDTNVGASLNFGGITGENTTGSTIKNCKVSGVITSTNRQLGGITAYNNGGIIEFCEVYADVVMNYSGTNNLYAGGLVGYNAGAACRVRNCIAQSDVTVTSPAGAANQNVGGAIGYNLASAQVINSYSTGSVSGGSTYKGGLIGRNAATVTNSYYDTDTSGQSDTGKGLPRTTLQMQQGTADSFILPAGGIDTGEDAANAMYTGWSVAIWKFTPLDKYPTLL